MQRRKHDLSRREMLRTLPLVAALPAVAALPTIAACNTAEAFTCTGVVGLSPAEIEARNLLAYVDRTPDVAKTCDNCVQYEPAAGGKCGGCKIMKGPIHPKGYCNVYALKG